jgi:hypothetical protein
MLKSPVRRAPAHPKIVPAGKPAPQPKLTIEMIKGMHKSSVEH